MRFWTQISAREESVCREEFSFDFVVWFVFSGT